MNGVAEAPLSETSLDKENEGMVSKDEKRNCGFEDTHNKNRRIKMTNRCALWTAAIACLMLLAPAGQAEVWDDIGGGNLWSDPANWAPAIPTPSTDAFVNDTQGSVDGQAVIGSGTNALADVATIGNGSGGIGRVSVEGSMTVNLLKAGEIGGRGFVNFQPGSSLVTLNNDLRLGGQQANTYGFVHFEGPGTTATIAGSIIAGNQNAGDLVIEGSTVNAGSGLTVGNASTGTLELMELGGTAGILEIGRRVRLGDGAGASGTITQGPNTIFRATSTDDVFRIGEAGAGVWNMNGGLLEIARVAGMELAAFGGGSSGTFNMSDGTVRVSNITAGGTANFNFGGGEIFLNGDRTGFAAATSFFNVTGNAADYTEAYNSGMDQTRLFYIPEPGALGVLCLGGAMMMSRRKNRR